MTKVVRSKGGEYTDCIVSHFGFDQYSSNSKEKVFFWGWNALLDKQLQEKYKHYSHRIFLDTASPCAFLSSKDFIESASYFTKFYTICPITSEILNLNGINSEAICFPYPSKKFKKYSNVDFDSKKYDCIYYGQIHDFFYKPMIKTISNYNHRFTTISSHGLDRELAGLVTNYNLTTEDKWSLINQSKSCVGVNLLFTKGRNPYVDHYIKNYNTTDKFVNMMLGDRMPQMKTRIVESAASNTLMLLYKDDFSIVEEWFKPNEHFVYWQDYQHLNEILYDISKNYSKYHGIIKNAKKHVEEYSIENFWRKINE